MVTITIPKTEYTALKQQAKAYQRLATQFFKSAQETSAADIVSDFKKTDAYSAGFLSDLETGLGRLHSSKEWKSK
jgi:hypothetical protein